MTINDPGLYRRMCEPFKSGDEANEHVEAFFGSVRELRERFKITDVVLVAQISFKDGEAEKIAQATLQIGNPANAEMMHIFGSQIARADYAKAMGVKA